MEEHDDGLRACPECGVLLERHVATIAATRDELEHTQKELAIARATISRMRGDQASRQKQNPHHDEAMEVLEHWRQLCAPRTRELNGTRLKNCLDRLDHGYTVEDLKASVEGYAAFPFVVEGRRSPHGSKRQRYIDAELIFRDAKHVDAGLNLRPPDGENGYVGVTPNLPPSLLAGIHWKRVQRANQAAMIRFLEERFGPGIRDDGWFYSRCPRCESPGDTIRMPSLTRNLPWLVECFHCGLKDEHLLGMMARESVRGQAPGN